MDTGLWESRSQSLVQIVTVFACFKCKIVVARLCLGPGPLDRAGGHLPAGDNVAAAGVHKAPPQTGSHFGLVLCSAPSVPTTGFYNHGEGPY